MEIKSESQTPTQPTSQHTSQPQLLYEGYLYKWTNFIKGWRVRYFMLDKDNKFYYIKKKEHEEDKDNKETKLIKLNHCKLIDEKKKKQFILEISKTDKMHRTTKVETKVTYLKTNTEEEKIKWIELLNHAIAKAKLEQETNEDESIKYIPQEHNRSDSTRSYGSHIKSNYVDEFTIKHDEIVSNIKNFHTFYLNFHMDAENFNFTNASEKEKSKLCFQEVQKQFDKITKYKSDFKVIYLIKLCNKRII